MCKKCKNINCVNLRYIRYYEISLSMTFTKCILVFYYKIVKMSFPLQNNSQNVHDIPLKK